MLDRPTLGLIKLGRVEEAVQVTEAYFASFRGDRTSRAGEAITKRVAKAQQKR